MREQFSKLKAGMPLTARRVNRLGRVAERVGGLRPGSNVQGRHGGSMLSMSVLSPWNQHIFEISADDGGGLYKGKIRWYSPSVSDWLTDAKEWEIDANDVEITLDVGDQVVAYWDEQRGMFIPMSVGTGVKIIRFQVDEPTGVLYTDPDFDVDNVTWIAGSGTAPTNVLNFLGFPAANNAGGIAIWDPNTDEWLGLVAPALNPCP